MERHPSLDDRFDPAVRLVEHDPKEEYMAGLEARALEWAKSVR